MDLNTENIINNNKIDLIKKINERLVNEKNAKSLNKEFINNIIFIYTPPKVASTSLVSSIRLSAPHKFNVIHIHDEKMLGSLIHTNLEGITINDIISYNKKLGKNIFVIDVFRDPIERKISEYFEQLSSLHFNNKEENLLSYPIQKIIDRFNKIFPHIGNEDYFKEKYNIEIPPLFDFEKKYILKEENGIKYIKLRMNDISSWNKILSEILETEIIIIKDYETESKLIGELYHKFKEIYQLPYSYFIELNNSPLLSYYYNNEEKKEYLDKWLNRIDNHSIKPYTKKEYDFYLKLCVENRYYNHFIQINHYMDNGCVCKFCSIKRNEIIEKIKKGEKINNEKIIHNSESIKREIMLNRKKLFLENKYKTNTLTSQVKMKNTMNNIVFTSFQK
jgi:hypothetical protein